MAGPRVCHNCKVRYKTHLLPPVGSSWTNMPVLILSGGLAVSILPSHSPVVAWDWVKTVCTQNSTLTGVRIFWVTANTSCWHSFNEEWECDSVFHVDRYWSFFRKEGENAAYIRSAKGVYWYRIERLLIIYQTSGYSGFCDHAEMLNFMGFRVEVVWNHFDSMSS